MTKKVAIVTGVTGQDGSYLSELLLEKDYVVVGIIRRSSSNNMERISHITSPNFKLVEGDITDSGCMYEIVKEWKPDEYYNLAAMSHVGTSFKQPELTFQVDTIGVLNGLEAVRKYAPKCHFLQASTSEMFGDNYSTRSRTPLCGQMSEVYASSPMKDSLFQKYQDERTRFSPQSPYGAAKLAAHELVNVYHKSYNIFACSTICFNHESKRRGENFVTRKITKWVADFYNWKRNYTGCHLDFDDKDNIRVIDTLPMQMELLNQKVDWGGSFPKLRLGNLEAKRDWGHAKDYVRGMWMVLQGKRPDNYILSTGETRSIKDLLDAAFYQIAVKDWERYVVIDPEFYRPAEVDYLCGDFSKIKKELGWKPRITFDQMIGEMVKHDMEK